MKKVRRGDPIAVSADFINRAIDATEQAESQRGMRGGGSRAVLRSGCVWGCNRTAVNLPQYSAVALTGPTMNWAAAETQCLDLYLPNMVADAVYGITQEPIWPGCVGKVAVQGLYPCVFPISAGETVKQYVVPSSTIPGQLAFGDSGDWRIIGGNKILQSDLQTYYYAFLRMGGGGGVAAEAEYSGAFKLAQTADSSGYQVIDGRQPDSLYCGKCLISSSVYDVSSVVVAWTAGTITEVYVVWVGGNRGAIISTTDNPTVPSMKIGIIQADGTILQLYQGSDMVIPGWVYLVTT